MDWWHRLGFPVRRFWVALSFRPKTRRNGGLLKLHNDVQSCGYEDIQVMWELLERSKLEAVANAKHKRRPIWKVFVWSKHSPTPPPYFA
ncbi:hypothetical protein K2173_009388 [Erythroxylum novogranatense]|uniref:Uncharacterized protein n=1 Tax=Erythroxylum novogranatense TaxID=1862640 RepID=A0AAV8U3T5_9ROSI|nr:hypothetical protein K2173_009388 [Erythroxylum novogranatense]